MKESYCEKYFGLELNKRPESIYTEENIKTINLFEQDSNGNNHIFYLAYYNKLYLLSENEDFSRLSIEIKKYIIESKSPFNHKASIIILASMYSNLENFKKLIEFGADINDKSAIGSTPLMFAARSGNEEIVSYLILSGANINATNKLGRNALMYAAISGFQNIALLLINNKIEINARDHSNLNALFYANCAENKKILDVFRHLSIGPEYKKPDNITIDLSTKNSESSVDTGQPKPNTHENIYITTPTSEQKLVSLPDAFSRLSWFQREQEEQRDKTPLRKRPANSKTK